MDPILVRALRFVALSVLLASAIAPWATAAAEPPTVGMALAEVPDDSVNGRPPSTPSVAVSMRHDTRSGASTPLVALASLGPEREVRKEPSGGAPPTPFENRTRSHDAFPPALPGFERGLVAQSHGVSIMGSTDDRKLVTPTTSYPASAIVKVLATVPESSFGPEKGVGCSGALIDDFHVLTAAHCVVDRLGPHYTDIVVIPGLDGGLFGDYRSAPLGNHPFGFAKATAVYYLKAWFDEAEPEHDFAVLTLDRSVGVITGYFGLWTGPSDHEHYTDWTSLGGYPGDLNGGQRLYVDYNRGLEITSHYRHFYYHDTAGGMSGGPVWFIDGDARYILSVHAYGMKEHGACCNSGTRLTNFNFDRVLEWTSLDPRPLDLPDLVERVPNDSSAAKKKQAFSAFTPSLLDGPKDLSITMEVRNTGTAAAGAFDVAFYASTDLVVTTADYLISKLRISGLAPFSNVVVSWTGDPSGVPDGKYKVGWVIDPANEVVERDDSGDQSGYQLGDELVVDRVPVSGWLHAPLKDNGVYAVEWGASNAGTGLKEVRLRERTLPGGGWETVCTASPAGKVKVEDACAIHHVEPGTHCYQLWASDMLGREFVTDGEDCTVSSGCLGSEATVCDLETTPTPFIVERPDYWGFLHPDPPDPYVWLLRGLATQAQHDIGRIQRRLTAPVAASLPSIGGDFR